MHLIVSIIIGVVFFFLLANAIFETIWGLCLITYGIVCCILATILQLLAKIIRLHGRIRGAFVNRSNPQKAPPQKISISRTLAHGEDKKAKHIFRSSNLATLGIAAAVCLVMANPSSKQETSKVEIHPLNHPALEMLQSMSTMQTDGAIVSPSTENWDEDFLNIAQWNQLPRGRWRIESKTDTVIKYIGEEIQDFLGGPARLVRIRTDSKTGKIQRIEVIWAEIGLSVGMASNNARGENGRESRKMRKQSDKDREEYQEAGQKFMEAVIKANHFVMKDLHKRFGKSKSIKMGKSPEVTTNIDEFTTKTGTSIRFFGEEKSMCMAIIIPTTVAEEQSRRVTLYDETSFNGQKRDEWAAKNVERRPNGDLVIRNLPMSEQGPRGYCAGTASSMILEYWGSPIPTEILASRYIAIVWLGDSVKHVNYHQLIGAAAKETSLRVKYTQDRRPIRFSLIAEELEAGRPVYFARNVSPERTALHTQWRDEVAKNPDFKIPEEDRDAKKKWPNELNDSHSSIITGYNKARKEIMITESWGEGHRNYRMSWDEFEATGIYIRTFEPR